jgi:hypothetical protein
MRNQQIASKSLTRKSRKTLESFANFKGSAEEWVSYLSKNLEFFSVLRISPSGAGVSETKPSTSDEAGKLESGEFSEFFWYQDLVRRVWAANDTDGSCLSVLFGINKASDPASPDSDISIARLKDDPFAKKASLPQGQPVVDGIKGKIHWQFLTAFQQSLYELMQDRWRAKVCRECGKYFIAEKTAQTLCSERCAHAAQVKRAIEYWHREGKAKRETKAKAKEKEK